MLAQGRAAKHEARQRLARELEVRAAKRAAAAAVRAPRQAAVGTRYLCSVS